MAVIFWNNENIFPWKNNNQNENKPKKFPIKKHKHTNMTEKNAQIFSCFSLNKRQQIVVRILKNNGLMLL